MAYPPAQPGAPPQMPWQPPPTAPPKQTGLIIGIVAAVVVAIVVILAALLLMGGGVVTTGVVTRNMTPGQFNTAMLDDFRSVNAGDTVIVTGTIYFIIAGSPPLTGTIVNLDNTTLLIPVDPPASCSAGSSFTMTLHVTVIASGGQSTKWFREFGDTVTSTPTVPASAIRCTGGGSQPISVSVGRSTDGTNWTITVASTPSGRSLTTTNLVIKRTDGSVALASAPLSTYMTTETSGVRYLRVAPTATFVSVGDVILIDTATYPQDFRFEISGGGTVFATGVLRA